MSLLQQLTLCLSLATLLFLRQTGSWNDSHNRYYFYWQRSDAFALMMSVLAFSFLFFLIARLTQRVWPARAASILQCLTTIFVVDVVVGFAAATLNGASGEPVGVFVLWHDPL